jgi:hypothetical protein
VVFVFGGKPFLTARAEAAALIGRIANPRVDVAQDRHHRRFFGPGKAPTVEVCLAVRLGSASATGRMVRPISGSVWSVCIAASFTTRTLVFVVRLIRKQWLNDAGSLDRADYLGQLLASRGLGDDWLATALVQGGP